jgi:DHA2 family multidrug resistance protein
MLGNLFNHSTTLTGIVMAPRGIGTMISMLLVGRLVRMIDPRMLVLTGLLLTAWSLHMMTNFTPQMDDTPVILSGIVQGLGLGLVFVPLSTLAFSTLDPRHRADGTSLFTLVRNIGSSIGISVVSVLLTRNIQINHSELASGLTPYNQNLAAALPKAITGDTTTLNQLDQLVNQQAAMISYVNDFKLMMIVTLFAIPLVFLLRRSTAPRPAVAAAHMD